MRRLALASFLALLFIASPALAYTSPGSPTGFVNDFAGVLSSEAKQSLETELTTFEKETSNEITVAIVKDLSGDYVENYAVKLFEDWGVGKDDRDNGVLLLVALEEREMRIEVGYGLEGALPDSLAQRILDNELTPKLREADYDGAITAGVRAIMAATKGEYAAEETQNNIPGNWSEYLELIFFGAVFGLQWLAAILGRSKPWWPGGVLGIAVAIGVAVFFGLSGTLGAILATVLGLFGFAFDYAVSNAYKNAKKSGGTPPWWSGGSGGGFGGRSSGGFGGFGGGSSGGGGASGRW